MIRISFFSFALLGVLFSQTAIAAIPQGIQCNVEQDQVNTAIFVETTVTQNYQACIKGSLSELEVIANIQFDGGSVDLCIYDNNMVKRALKSFTADNYNGTSLVMDNLSIPTAQGDYFTFVISVYNGATCVMPATNDVKLFVGELRVGNTPTPKNLKFTTGFLGAAPDLDAVDQGRGRSSNAGQTVGVHARVASGLDLSVEGDCVSAQRKSTGVLNFEGETFVQIFSACDRGQIGQIKVAVPFVEPGQEFNYGLLRTDNSLIEGGVFTQEDVTDGELLLTFDKGSVRKGQKVMLKISCPEGARLAALANGASGSSFGRLYINGQAAPYNLAMCAGLTAATANDVEAEHEGRDKVEIGAYPVPFGQSLSITIRGVVKAGATLQLLNHQGMPLHVVSLAGGKLDAPIRFRDLGHLRPGLYTIRLHNGDNVVSKRILKG